MSAAWSQGSRREDSPCPYAALMLTSVDIVAHYPINQLGRSTPVTYLPPDVKGLPTPGSFSMDTTTVRSRDYPRSPVYPTTLVKGRALPAALADSCRGGQTDRRQGLPAGKGSSLGDESGGQAGQQCWIWSWRSGVCHNRPE
ncbi:hypothetical protein ACOMHN_049971 [Nucella lapillus]